MTNKGGVALIAAERERQISSEGWTAEHDDEHEDGQLAVAAVCYAELASQSAAGRDHSRGYGAPNIWPWVDRWWKPGVGNTTEHRIRELVKAGALLAAEIDRLQRAEGKS